jgi:hypothetical protein
VELPNEGITLVQRGGNGSSGTREENGRWAHTFGLLASKYGIETPTYFMRYDAHNVWKKEFELETFATLGRDLSGNYQSCREVMAPIFKGRTWHTNSNDDYVHTYEKTEGDHYW